MMTTSYSEILARNIRIARARGRVSQESTGMRMSSLGFTAWHRQTMGKAERGERRLTAEEILGLAVVLETSVGALLSPEADDGAVAFPAGMAVGAVSVRRSVRGTRDDGIAWQDDQPVVTSPAVSFVPGTVMGRENRNGVSLQRLLAGMQAQLAGLADDREEAS